MGRQLVARAARMVARAAGRGKAARVLLACLLVLAPPAWALETGELTIHTRQGPLTYFVEIARTPADRSQGLMFREDLPSDHGMLFDFEVERPVGFWMKNTPISLDLLFVKDGGEIVRITERATPYALDVLPSGQPVRYVLEILGGTAERRGVRVGDRLELPPD